MFNDEDIKKKVSNKDGQRLVPMSNRIINLDHVKYFEFVARDKTVDQKGEIAVVVHFADGQSLREDFGHIAYGSHCWSTIKYCLEHGLMGIEFQSHVYSRLEQYARDLK